MKTLLDNQRVPIRYYLLSDINKEKLALVQVDRRWHSFRMAKRDDTTGLWRYEDLPSCTGEAVLKPHTASSITLDQSLGPGRTCISALVHVEFHLPFKVDGVVHQVHSGIALVIDASLGLIVVDKHTVPTTVGDILLTFANSIIIPGKLVYLHQIYNFAVVTYDVRLLGETIVTSAPISSKPLNQGDSVYLVCLTKTYQPIVRKTIVTNIRQFYVNEPLPPAYRATNVEGIELENPIAQGGVLTDETGSVQALYAAFTKHVNKGRNDFYMGMPIDVVFPVVGPMREALSTALAKGPENQTTTVDGGGGGGVVTNGDDGDLAMKDAAGVDASGDNECESGGPAAMDTAVTTPPPAAAETTAEGGDGVRHLVLVNGVRIPVPRLNGLEVELTYAQVAHARILGLSDEWVKRIEGSHLSRRNVLVVRRLTSGTQASKLLKEGDIILAVDGTPATKFVDIMRHTDRESLELTILREGKEVVVTAPLSPLEISGTERIAGWSGAIFQMPHKAVFQQLKQVPRGVLCSVVYDGSPSQLYALHPLTWVTEVNGQTIEDLDQFLEAVSNIPTDSFVRIRTVNFNRFVKVALRIRPLSSKELAKDNVTVAAQRLDDQSVLTIDPYDEAEDVLRKDRPRERVYNFDYVFGETASQVEVFDKTTKFLIDFVVKGFNATVFAYGTFFANSDGRTEEIMRDQESHYPAMSHCVPLFSPGPELLHTGATGAGKTYTMMGTESSPGIMSLTLMDLFARIDEAHQQKQGSYDSDAGKQKDDVDDTYSGVYDVSMSYLEIYNENIRDLLSGKPDYLELREDANKGVVVAGVTTVSARSADEVLNFLMKGNRHRTTEATGANEVSSRSHAILQVSRKFIVESRENVVFVGRRTISAKGHQKERFGKLSMIDLAGSERAAETKNRGMRMIEGANINRSLLALGNCINALGEQGRKSKYVNYRDSKLTRLLKDSLGGNCRTVMIANISPSSDHIDETHNTLKYASRARAIKTKVYQQVSYKYDPYNSAIYHLHHEIDALKQRLAGSNAGGGAGDAASVHSAAASMRERESAAGGGQNSRALRHLRKKTKSSVTLAIPDDIDEDFDGGGVNVMVAGTGAVVPTSRSRSLENLSLDGDLSAHNSNPNSFASQLQSLFREKMGLRGRWVEVGESAAEYAVMLEKKRKELEALEKFIEDAESGGGGEGDEQVEKARERVEEVTAGVAELEMKVKSSEKARRNAQNALQDVDEQISAMKQKIHKSLDKRSRQYFNLIEQLHNKEFENLDLTHNYALSKSALIRKESDVSLLYRQLDLFDRIAHLQEALLAEKNISLPRKVLGLYKEIDSEQQRELETGGGLTVFCVGEREGVRGGGRRGRKFGYWCVPRVDEVGVRMRLLLRGSAGTRNREEPVEDSSEALEMMP
ncbi:Kinesin-like protein kif19, partial [Quaeritorhiza haematococci]